jgi:L-iditol 2-dehydrogenase
MSNVKAAVLRAPGEIQIQEFPYPTLRGGDVILRMEMAGICGTDKHTYRGATIQYADTAAQMSTPFPIIQGHEIVGTVAEIHPDAAYRLEFYGKRLKVGDRVVICPDVICGRCWYCRHVAGYPLCENLRSYGNSYSCADPPHLFGGFAEYIYIAPNVFVYKVPVDLPPNMAVMAELMAVTASLDKAREFSSLGGEGFHSGDTVVIQGVGPLGIVHVIKARMLGAGEIIAIDHSPLRLNLAKRFGADTLLDLSRTTLTERAEAVRAATQGRGADLVIECAGEPEAFLEGVELARMGGMYIVAGVFSERGAITMSPHRHILAKNLRIIGVRNHPYTAYGPAMELMRKWRDRLPWQEFVTHRYPVVEAAAAMTRSLELDTMKVVIEAAADV